jgi:hypothetical protein
MNRKIGIILGNGFTIDFVKYLSANNCPNAAKINVSNLFGDGSSLRWPLDGRPGFLSYKHCPNLWNAGARSFLSATETLEILERVVTCANVYSLKKTEHITEKTGNGFLHAYKELVTYLKYLFIHYNSLITDIPDSIEDWPWAKFLQQINNDDGIEEVVVISYNYDIWLERLLRKLGIKFSFPMLSQQDGAKFHIFKPHGSISYQHKKSLPRDSFSINYNSFFLDCPISDIAIAYSDLEKHTPVSFIIPPAGESGRSSSTWAQIIRNECRSRIASFKETDIAVLCGISYWHVDRNEVDSILNSMHSEMDLIHLDPAPSPTLDAVLNSLFSRYTHLPSSSLLESYPL